MTAAPVDRGPQRHALVIGGLDATRLTCTMLRARGVRVTHLTSPDESAIGRALETGVTDVAVLVRGDVEALRYVLLVEHLRPGIAVVATIFDSSVAEQIRRVVPRSTVTSPAEVVTPSVVAACLDEGLAVVDAPDGGLTVIAEEDGELVSRPWPGAGHRLRSWLDEWRPRWHDGSSGLFLGGLAGLVVILVADWLLSVLVLDESPMEALYVATRIVATVGPAEAELHHVPEWYLGLSVFLMLAAIVFTGAFVAGLVEWLVSTRSIGLVGRRSAPSRDHVVVAGLGQVGLRVCLRLRRLGIPVLAVERNPDAENLRLARDARVPVLIGHAEDRAQLRRAALPRARAIAALGSNDLDNVAVAITALSVSPEARVVLRAGEGGEQRAVAETRSLFRIGRVCDVSSMTALTATQAVLEQPASVVVVRDAGITALVDGGEVPCGLVERCSCP